MDNHGMISALENLAKTIASCHRENMEKHGKILDLLTRQLSLAEMGATDLALMSQTLTDCEKHLHALADHFDPPKLEY